MLETAIEERIFLREVMIETGVEGIVLFISETMPATCTERVVVFIREILL